MKHPDLQFLLDFAAGVADTTSRILVEAHAAHCPACTETLRSLRASAARFDATAEDPSHLEALFTRIAAKTKAIPPAAKAKACVLPSGYAFPPAVAAELPPVEQWDWATLWPTPARAALLHVDPATGMELYCLHYQAGALAPHHRHRDPEETVILAGGYRSGDEAYGAGDWDAQVPGTHHAPRVDIGGECVCLLRSRGGIPWFIGRSAWRRVVYSAYNGVMHLLRR